jgi:uncharacterized protein involved in exopolysaccharide biosynthesis
VNLIEDIEPSSTPEAGTQKNWVRNATSLWENRRLLARIGGFALVLSTLIAFTLPKQYESSGRLMPPDQPSSGGAMLALLAGRSLGGSGLGALGGLAGSLLGGRTSSALYQDLLQSRSISDHLIDRFDLQHIYHKRYRIDTVKYLMRHTTIVEDKKSGVITLTFTDTNPQRAQAIAQAYLEELNAVLTKSNTSAAHREREFIEKRLVKVQADLESAEKALSQFSSVHTTLDIKEQTHAMVDAAAKLQAELIVGQSELESLQQIYGNENVRVRAARARIGSLQHDLMKLGGSSAVQSDDTNLTLNNDNKNLYPSIRQLPRLAVPYANLYRRVRIQETVFELLSQQYEMARIEEAKDTPVVGVIDYPQVAEKKSFPPRMIMLLSLTLLSLGMASFLILMRDRWRHLDASDHRKVLARAIAMSLSKRWQRLPLKKAGES